MHNEAVLQGMDFDLVDGFHNTASKFDDQVVLFSNFVCLCFVFTFSFVKIASTIYST